MDNDQISSAQPITPAQLAQTEQFRTNPNDRPMIQQVQAPVEKKKDVAGLIKTIVIIFVSLIAVTFIGLFIWMSVQYNELGKDIQGQIDDAVSAAEVEVKDRMEIEFLEREKEPYKPFVGPADYGQLSFEYPRTWSVYIAQAATSGGDFSAYFNPNQVEEIGKNTVNALRVLIQNKSFEDVTAEYQRYLDQKESNLTMETITFNGITGNKYTGKIPGTELNGFIVIFKIRDKTVIMQTDSVLFENDFNNVLGTVTFNA
ncbi:hypothetical protein J6S37_00650 [Candidatus Saccharibacteria bacterium]|nr:hypothetical protein [Candidatus Saccharibacteria bacterium]